MVTPTPKQSTASPRTTKDQLEWFQARRTAWQKAPRPKLRPLSAVRNEDETSSTTVPSTKDRVDAIIQSTTDANSVRPSSLITARKDTTAPRHGTDDTISIKVNNTKTVPTSTTTRTGTPPSSFSFSSSFGSKASNDHSSFANPINSKTTTTTTTRFNAFANIQLTPPTLPTFDTTPTGQNPPNRSSLTVSTFPTTTSSTIIGSSKNKDEKNTSTFSSFGGGMAFPVPSSTSTFGGTNFGSFTSIPSMTGKQDDPIPLKDPPIILPGVLTTSTESSGHGEGKQDDDPKSDPTSVSTTGTTTTSSIDTMQTKDASIAIDEKVETKESPKDPKTRLIAFYQKYNPEKLDTVESTLIKYQGKEDDLFQKLEAKYIHRTSIPNPNPTSKYPPPCGEGPTCFLKLSIGGEPVGTVTMKLYEDKVPLACGNFQALCTGVKGWCRTSSSRPLCYKNSKIHRIVPSFCIQAGDFTRGDGTGGESIFQPNIPGVSDAMGRFKDEFFMQHSKVGLLSMANNGPNRNGSQFFFTLRPVASLDGKHVVFGEVLSGLEILQEKIGKLPTTPKQQPREPVVISDCGMIVDGKEIPCQYKEQETPPSKPFGLFSFGTSTVPGKDTTTNTSSNPFGTPQSTSGNNNPFSFGSTPSSIPPSTSVFGSTSTTTTPDRMDQKKMNDPLPPFGFGKSMTGTGSTPFSFGGLASL